MLFNKFNVDKKLFVLFLSIAILSIFSANVMAVPSLGIATNRTYYVSTDPGSTFEAYQDHFASDWAYSATEGFSVQPGDEVFIWSNLLDSDIYIMTNNFVATTAYPITYGGKELAEVDTYNTKAGPNQPTPYYGLNIEKVRTCTTDSSGNETCMINDGWEPLPQSIFSPNNGNGNNGADYGSDQFYFFKAILDFTWSPDLIGEYFFVAANQWDNLLTFNSGNNGVGKCSVRNTNGTCTDSFSPRTTSLTIVPEPGTLILLGSGLFGIGAFRRKFKR